MKITLNVDDEIVKKVHKLAADKNTTLTAMVREYLATVANTTPPDEAARKEAAEKFRVHVASIIGRASTGDDTTEGQEAADKLAEHINRVKRPMGGRNWKREDLYDRPKAYAKRD